VSAAPNQPASGHQIEIAPSIIAADFLKIGDAIASIEGAADMLHLDVMDGQFVPNITFGSIVVEAARRRTKMPLDVHLMIADPDRYLADFAKAGASTLTVHLEAATHLHRTISHIKSLGAKAGVAINPSTPVGMLDEIIEDVDVVLVMSVNPGFTGQTFIARSPSKVAAVRALIARRGARARIEVDGGIDPGTIGPMVAAGADIIVAGVAVFRQPDPAAAIKHLREAAVTAVQRG
jgi:ribulose-phosphate 3-epimerase